VCVCVCVCVCVALVIQQAKRMLRIYFRLWPEWFYHILPLNLIHSTNFGKKLLNTKR